MLFGRCGCALVLGLFVDAFRGVGGFDELWGGDGAELFHLTFGVDALGAGERLQRDGPAGLEGFVNAFNDADVGVAFFAIGFDLGVVQDAA